MATVKKMSKSIPDTAVADTPQSMADTNGTAGTYATHDAYGTSADSATTEIGVQEPVAVPPVFSLERLRRDSVKLFGVSISTFAGATHGRTGEFTLAEMKEIISEWLGKPIANFQRGE